MKSLQADAKTTQVLMAHRESNVVSHDRGDDIFAGLSKA